MKIRLLLVSVCILSLSGCGYTSMRASSDYASQLSRNEILIIPAYAEAYTLETGGGQTRMYDYESYVEPVLVSELEAKLKEKGYRVRIMHKKDLMNNKTYHEYGAFRESFAAAYQTAYKDRERVKEEVAKNSTITLSGRARDLGQKLGAPVLAFVDYNETVHSAGSQAVGMAVAMIIGGGGPQDTGRAVVALIDTKNDKVLWVNAGNSLGGGPIAHMINTDQEESLHHVQTTLKWALDELPDRDKLFEKND